MKAAPRRRSRLPPFGAIQLRLVGEAPRTGDVETGELVVRRLRRALADPQLDPTARPPDLVEQQRETAAAFGWQWQHFSELHPEFEAQFLDWLAPDRHPSSSRGSGCSTPAAARAATRISPPRTARDEVVALDLSDAVETAQRNLRAFDNVHVVQGDLLRPPLRTAADGGGFDLIYSIGVLHHLPDPVRGLPRAARYLRPGGTIAVWVYGYENNGFVRELVEPLRRVSTKIPPSVLRPLAWPLALGFHGVAKGVYRPLAGTQIGRRASAERIPVERRRLQLPPELRHRLRPARRADRRVHQGPGARAWFARCGVEDARVTPRHGNSWRGQGRAPTGSE